jgi:YidC/Oxa1 family membrane protein insertase
MISSTFDALLYRPLYNLLVALIDIPYIDAGVAVIVLTVIVKLLLFPISMKAVRAQEAMTLLQPELTAIQEKHKDDRNALALATLELYRKNGVNPFSGILTILIQIPIILALYWVFYKGGLPVIDVEKLYSFVPNPSTVDTTFIGLLEVTQSKSVIIALLTAATAFLQANITMMKPNLTSKPGESMRDDMVRSMHMQMKYVLPLVVGFVAFGLQAVVGLYWITSNLFGIGQHLYIKSKMKKVGAQVV